MDQRTTDAQKLLCERLTNLINIIIPTSPDCIKITIAFKTYSRNVITIIEYQFPMRESRRVRVKMRFIRKLLMEIPGCAPDNSSLSIDTNGLN